MRAGCTSMHVGLAVWAAVLSRHTGQSEVVVGFPYAHREHQLLAPLVGYFVNTLAVVVSVVSEESFLSLAGTVSRAVLGGLRHGSIPFVQVVKALNRLRRQERSPVYQNMFFWEEGFGGDGPGMPTMVGLEVLGISGYQTSALDVELHLSSASDRTGWSGHISYNTELLGLDAVR